MPQEHFNTNNWMFAYATITPAGSDAYTVACMMQVGDPTTAKALHFDKTFSSTADTKKISET